MGVNCSITRRWIIECSSGTAMLNECQNIGGQKNNRMVSKGKKKSGRPALSWETYIRNAMEER